MPEGWLCPRNLLLAPFAGVRWGKQVSWRLPSGEWCEHAMLCIRVVAARLLLSQLHGGLCFLTKLNLCHEKSRALSSSHFSWQTSPSCAPAAPRAAGQLQKLVPGHICPYLTLGFHPSQPPMKEEVLPLGGIQHTETFTLDTRGWTGLCARQWQVGAAERLWACTCSQ